jgi:hypothetical protein
MGAVENYLHRWIIYFDMACDPVLITKIGAILRGFPLPFWNKEALRAIGNKLVHFVDLEPSWESKFDRRWAWVLIEVDITEGLVEKIDLVCNSFNWVQRVDYWLVPFR